MFRKAFTLIELLIVIAILGLIAVAVLSAINPLEQFKKAADARRKSDAAELLNAYERYYTTYGCYPWERNSGAGPCAIAVRSADAADFVDATKDVDLITVNELKPQFATRTSVAAGKQELKVTKAADGLVSVCFTPESINGRSGGSGKIMDDTNAADGTCDVAGTYDRTDAACNVCLPQ